MHRRLAALCEVLLVALKSWSGMKRADLFFVIVVLFVFLALLFIVMNIHHFFPTPAPEAFAESVIPAT